MRHRTWFYSDPGNLIIPNEEAVPSSCFVPNYKQHVLICDEETLDKTQKNWLTVTVSDMNWSQHDAWLLLLSTKTGHYHRWKFEDMYFFVNNMGFTRYKVTFKLDETVPANVALPEIHKDWRMSIYCDAYNNSRPGHILGPPLKNIFPIPNDTGKYMLKAPDIKVP